MPMSRRSSPCFTSWKMKNGKITDAHHWRGIRKLNPQKRKSVNIHFIYSEIDDQNSLPYYSYEIQAVPQYGNLDALKI